LVFNTIQTKEKFAAMHLFQSDRVPAAVVATEIMKASSSKSVSNQCQIYISIKLSPLSLASKEKAIKVHSISRQMRIEV